MTIEKEYEFFIDQLLDAAASQFKASEEYALLREKLDQMHLDCEMMLNEEQQNFAEECFGLIKDAGGRQESYVYRKGIRDCVNILKLFGVF